MMARRRWPRPMPGSSRKPSPSGPRWAMESFIAARMPGSIGLVPFVSKMPESPHIGSDHAVLDIVDQRPPVLPQRRTHTFHLEDRKALRRGLAIGRAVAQPGDDDMAQARQEPVQ